ncbi:MAG TPA: hypothetical protein VFX49_06170 [Chloroflexota bacterium]|nr:hypothetical protein [Chloroflexota bacterium]
MMMLMMPFMLVFWVVLIVGVVALVRWLSHAGESTREGRRLRGLGSGGRPVAGGGTDGGVLPDDEIERGVFEAHRRIGELQEQLSWQGRLLASEASSREVSRRIGARSAEDRAERGDRAERAASAVGAPTTSPPAGRSRRRRTT